LRRITKAALGGLAGCALVLGGTQFAAGSLVGTYRSESDDLKDPEAPFTNDGVFDSAKARVTIVETTDPSTTFTFRLTGIDGEAGQEFGAHLHVGPCDNTGPHYKNDFFGSVDNVNEAWFAVVVDDGGSAVSQTTVGWVPNDAKSVYGAYTPGKMSIVIHEGTLLQPAPNPKQACFPLSVPQWADGA
jgi:hypothetical protein